MQARKGRDPQISAPARAAVLVVSLGLASAGLYGVVRLAHQEPPSSFPRVEGRCSGVWVDDFLQDYASARGWRDGQDVYAPSRSLQIQYFGPAVTCYQYTPIVLRNPHPPSLILLGVPFTYLAYREARLAWLAFNATLLVIGAVAFGRERGLRPSISLVWGLAALAIPVVQKDLSLGQTNCLVLAFVVLGWTACRHKSDLIGGTLLGAAAALKLFPLLFVVPVLREKGKRVALSILTSWAILSGIAAALVGAGSSYRYVSTVLTDNFRFWVGEPRNISAAAAIARWFMRTVWHPGGLNLPTLGSIVALVFIGAAIVLSYATPARLSEDRFWATTPWVVLAVPLAWEHYAVLVTPLILTVTLRARSARSLPPIGWMIAAAVTLVGILPGLPSQIGRIPLLAQVFGYGLPTYGLLALGCYEWKGLRESGFDLALAPDHGPDAVIASTRG